MSAYDLLSLFAIASIANGIILRRNVQDVDFPRQYASGSDLTQFVRVDGGRLVTIKCPNHFQFDDKLLRCDINTGLPSPPDYSRYCDKDHDGVVANPMNCRSFINCWKGNGYLQYCPQNELFGNWTTTCTFPDQANCCEYWEDDSSVIV